MRDLGQAAHACHTVRHEHWRECAYRCGLWANWTLSRDDQSCTDEQRCTKNDPGAFCCRQSSPTISLGLATRDQTSDLHACERACVRACMRVPARSNHEHIMSTDIHDSTFPSAPTCSTMDVDHTRPWVVFLGKLGHSIRQLAPQIIPVGNHN
eukprot:scaffold190135_cov19-Tisochrysis_lutea.AAC.1